MFREMESIQVEMKEMEVGYMYIYIYYKHLWVYMHRYACTHFGILRAHTVNINLNYLSFR